MEQIAFKMQLYPGKMQEYKQRHDAIWPELVSLLKASGVSDYSIFLDEETHILFGVLRRTAAHQMDALPTHAVMQRWWAYMQDLMESQPDNAPVVKPLTPVFHLD